MQFSSADESVKDTPKCVPQCIPPKLSVNRKLTTEITSSKEWNCLGYLSTSSNNILSSICVACVCIKSLHQKAHC